MHALLIQFADPRRPEPLAVFSHTLGVLAALAQQRGITCRLVTLGGFRREPLVAAVTEHTPEAIVVDVPLQDVAAARRTTAALRELTDAPVVVVGAYATARPTRAISFPGATALILGEYERPTVAWLEAIRDGRAPSGIDGLWTYADSGLIRSRPAPLVENLDDLPYPDRALFDTDRIVKATGELTFKTARGCPFWCAYCINDWYMDLYEYDNQQVPFVRRRSVGNVLDEVRSVATAYPHGSSVVFYDHAFATDRNWLEQFAAAYGGACELPFRCHVRLEKVTPELAATLAAGNCRWVHTHIGSGSRFIREDVLSMHMSDATVVDACRHLSAAGLRIAAEVFIGAPYESEITVEETIRLLRRAGIDDVHPRGYWPAPGTRAAELCRENGWLTRRRDADAYANRATLDMPGMPPEQVDAVIDKLPALLKRRRRTALRKVLDRAATRRKRRAVR
ncbi:MAG: radical SAM protein [Phycisphaerae bacterium]|nr:radical SAM protein [Phycisphaerae bacterium]